MMNNETNWSEVTHHRHEPGKVGRFLRNFVERHIVAVEPPNSTDSRADQLNTTDIIPVVNSHMAELYSHARLLTHGYGLTTQERKVAAFEARTKWLLEPDDKIDINHMYTLLDSFEFPDDEPTPPAAGDQPPQSL